MSVLRPRGSVTAAALIADLEAIRALRWEQAEQFLRLYSLRALAETDHEDPQALVECMRDLLIALVDQIEADERASPPALDRSLAYAGSLLLRLRPAPGGTSMERIYEAIAARWCKDDHGTPVPISPGYFRTALQAEVYAQLASRLLAQTAASSPRPVAPVGPDASADPVLFTFDDDGALPFPTFADGARAISVLSRTAVNLLGHYESTFEKLLRRGAEVRLIMVDPSSPAARHLYGRSETLYRSNHTVASAHIERLRQLGAPGSLEIRLCQEAPSFSMVIAEREDPVRSAMHVQLNMLYSKIGRDRPVFALYGTDTWYAVFVTEFEEVWRRAKPLET